MSSCPGQNLKQTGTLFKNEALGQSLSGPGYPVLKRQSSVSWVVVILFSVSAVSKNKTKVKCMHVKRGVPLPYYCNCWTTWNSVLALGFGASPQDSQGHPIKICRNHWTLVFFPTGLGRRTPVNVAGKKGALLTKQRCLKKHFWFV